MLEGDEQIALLVWVNDYLPLVPALKWFYHVPNGDERDKVLQYDRRTGKEYWLSPTG